MDLSGGAISRARVTAHSRWSRDEPTLSAQPPERNAAAVRCSLTAILPTLDIATAAHRGEWDLTSTRVNVTFTASEGDNSQRPFSAYGVTCTGGDLPSAAAGRDCRYVEAPNHRPEGGAAT